LSARPWYPRYPRDFRAKTLHLTLLQRGAYCALIDHYYEIGAPLPADPEALYRIAGAYALAEREAVDSVASEFFTNGDGRLNNARCDEEIQKMRDRSAQASDLAHKRWANAKAVPTHSQRNASHSHISQSQSQLQSKSKTSSKADARATRLATDWVLPPDWSEWAVKDRAWTPEHALSVSNAFHDFWVAKAGKDARKLDWFATWRNWVRNDNGKVRDNGSKPVYKPPKFAAP